MDYDLADIVIVETHGLVNLVIPTNVLGKGVVIPVVVVLN